VRQGVLVTIRSHSQRHGLLLARVQLVSQLRLLVRHLQRPVRRQVTAIIRVLHRAAHHGNLHLLVVLVHRPVLLLVGHSLLLAQRRGLQHSHQVVRTRVPDLRLAHGLQHGLQHGLVVLDHRQVLLPGQVAHVVEAVVDQVPHQEVEVAAAEVIAQAALRVAQAPARAVAAHRADLAPHRADLAAVAAVVAQVLAQVLPAAHQAAAEEEVAQVLAQALVVAVDKQRNKTGFL
jgi:hypothetical protein